MTSAVDETTLANAPGALSLQPHRDDDQDEWEYEYSTTETETYYLTIELSYPEFKDRQSKAVHHSRGGYYKHWLDQTPGQLKAAGEADNEADNDNDMDDEPLPEPEADDDEPDVDPDLHDQGKGVDREEGAENDNDKTQANNEDGNQVEDIQVLDLHSKHPVISYKGRVFEGEWAEVIGTEAIFAHRDAENPLPALRCLDKNLDLLGASASRILTKEKILKPKVLKEDPLAAIRDEWNIRIPVGKDRTGERAEQTRFLENLIALKIKKGETDRVTVYARDGQGKDFKDSRDPDYKPRRRKRILNEDGEEVITKRDRRRGGRRAGRPRSRMGRVRGGAVAVAASAPAIDFGAAATDSNGLSTPTPDRWENLEEMEEEDDNGDDDDEEMEDGSESDEDEDMRATD